MFAGKALVILSIVEAKVKRTIAETIAASQMSMTLQLAVSQESERDSMYAICIE